MNSTKPDDSGNPSGIQEENIRTLKGYIWMKMREEEISVSRSLIGLVTDVADDSTDYDSLRSGKWLVVSEDSGGITIYERRTGIGAIDPDLLPINRVDWDRYWARRGPV